MITIRPSEERGHVAIGWLDSRHTFSFGEYYDPAHMGFRALRVINEDVVAPSQGFGTHPHRDMEIITYVLDGALQHRDSLGNGSAIVPGEVQRMTAGTGIRHSEMNPSPDTPVHLLQIWLLPEREGLEPGYEQRAIPRSAGGLTLIASRDGREGSVTVHQSVDLYSANLAAGDQVVHELASGRHAWVQVASGRLTVNGRALNAGDAVALSDEPRVEIQAGEQSELLLFDLA
ncbi:MAG: pirin family protein [Candidatus Binatia bacterium]